MSYLLTIIVNFWNQAFDLLCNTAVRLGEGMHLWAGGAGKKLTGGSDAGLHRRNRR